MKVIGTSYLHIFSPNFGPYGVCLNVQDTPSPEKVCFFDLTTIEHVFGSFWKHLQNEIYYIVQNIERISCYFQTTFIKMYILYLGWSYFERNILSNLKLESP